MSGTKSHCLLAPAINPAESTLVLGWYGSRNKGDHARIEAHVRTLVEMFGFASGCSVPLMIGANAEPASIPVLDDVRHVVVLPVFMCEGMTFNRQFPEFLRQLASRQSSDRPGGQVAGAGLRSLPIIGRHESLVRLVSSRASVRAGTGNTDRRLVLVAHGSEQNTGSMKATRKLRDHLRSTEAFSEVHDAYLETTPDPADIVSSIGSECIIEGLFLTEGRHSTDDMVARIGSGHSSHTPLYLGAVGVDPRFIDVLSGAVSDAVSPAKAA